MINDTSIGPFAVHMYRLILSIGFLVAFWLCMKHGKKIGLREDIIWEIFCCAIIGGLLGAMVLYCLVELPGIIDTHSRTIAWSRGYLVYGGIIGGIICAWVFCGKK